MAGLLSQNTSPNTIQPMLGAANMAQATSTGIDPEKRAVDAAKETVSGQLDTLLKSGSPYLERARAGAAQFANKRGLLNSSIAAGAGEGAAIDAAAPIASADAQTYSAAAKDNQNVGNAALQFNADASNKASLVNMDAMNQGALQTLKGEQANLLANIEGSYKSLIQSSDSAGKLYQQAVDAINKTLTSADLEPAAKDAAVRRQTELLRMGLGVIGKIGELDLTSLLNFGPVNA